MFTATISHRPRFRRHLRAEIGSAGVFLFGEHGVTVLQGREVAALAGLLDGRHDPAAIVAARPGGLSPAQVDGLLARLVDAGLVVFGPPATGVAPKHVAAWWDGCGVDAATLPDTRRVGLSVLGGGLDASPVRSALAAAGVDVVTLTPDALDQAPPVDLGVVLCTDYLDPGLGAVDAAHRRAGRPWLLAKLDGARTWLGPVFEPAGDGGCWHCLAHRLWGHRNAEAVAQRELGHDGPALRPASSLPSVAGAAAHLVALEVSKWVAGHRYGGQRGVWVLDTHELIGERHPLRARPQCPACGDPDLVAHRTDRPVVLRPAPRSGGSGGGDRTLSPAQMLERHRHLIGPVTGIVKGVVPDPGAPAFAHAYRSGPNVSRQVGGMAALRRSLRAENGGKGFTAVDAEVGALCEAAERFSGTAQGDELRIRGSLTDLGARAVDPRGCLLFAGEQYAERATWNPAHSPFNHVPEPFDPTAETDWTPLWSLTHRRHLLLPTSMLYFGGPPDRTCYADSNGCAAGSSLEDAVLQGALELVERDAVAQWWYNRLLVPEVDLAAFGTPFTEQRHHHAGIGRELRVLDVTSDLGVPAMAAVSRRTGGGGERIMLGFGAHLDPTVAVRRAVSEVNQMLATEPSDPNLSDDPDYRAWAGTATTVGHPYLRPDAATRPRRPADHPEQRLGDVRDDVHELVRRFTASGLETLVLDQTRPDVGIPVVRVVVPGLRSFWSRFAPGRLFDAPVRAGRLARPTPYSELNPVPLFL